MATIREIELALSAKKNNLTAARWLRDERAKARILEKHTTWNEDHLKINEPHMIIPLEDNVDYYLSNPSLIDRHSH